MPTRKVKNERLIRALRVADSEVDEASRKVKFSFSSELPVERWFGLEILSHAPGACDLSRMNGGANVLFNHNSDDYVGVVDSAYIGEDKRGYCEIRFGEGDLAAEVMRDVASGILRNVSFGYQITDLILSRQGENGQDSEYTATEWQPYEVSFVTIPADPTVGVGRSVETCENERLKELVAKADHRALEQKPVEVENTPTIEVVKEEVNQENENPAASTAQEEKTMSQDQMNDVLKEERARVRAIEAMCERHEMKDLARELVDGGKSVDEARAAVMHKMESRAQKPIAQGAAGGEIGLSDKEKRSFSFMNVIRAQMFPQDKKIQEAAAMEREISEAACKASGKTARGMLIPFDVLNKRDVAPQQVTQAPLGGNLVQTQLLSSSFIDLLRNHSALVGSGAQILTGLSGALAIPRQIQASTAYWVGEGQDVPLSDVMFDQVPLTPKTVGSYVEYTRKLMLQSSLDIEAMLRKDIAEVIALEIDRAALYGTGSGNMPRGVKNQAGINVVAGGGATPSWAQIVSMESAVTVANADIGATKYLLGAGLQGTLKTTPIAPGGYPLFLLGPDGKLNGYDKVVSNQVAVNDIFFGVWSQLIMGFWSGLDVVVDPYTKSTSGNVRIVAMQDCDIAIRQPKAFSVSTYGS
jgi:HK97 family phage major capsid protein/HK97 family phage prohead protease